MDNTLSLHLDEGIYTLYQANTKKNSICIQTPDNKCLELDGNDLIELFGLILKKSTLHAKSEK